MKLKFFLFFLFFASLHLASLPATDLAEVAMEECDYKEAIEIYLTEIQRAKKEEASAIKAKLALAYYRDQEDEKAFKTYLEALSEAPQLTAPTVTVEEQKLYDEALGLYLNHVGYSAHEIANEIRQKFSPTLALHHNYYLLNFIVAAAYANMGMFDQFFERFYDSYRYYPDQFMAYKTKAILYVKLHDRAKTDEEREVLRRDIYANAIKANERNAKDASLYRMIVTYAPADKKSKVMADSLQKIINENIIIPRTDIVYFVKEAVAVGQTDLAQKFIDKAKEWYEYSRMLQTAQNFLDNKSEKT